ncbi:hypothetical protein LWM68_05650 [Niabella sp. W65]|nr:hypothetical protein [Niabella sp. W65]MCH7362292.1 hypothetical protein [Niabella sp. W65]
MDEFTGVSCISQQAYDFGGYWWGVWWILRAACMAGIWLGPGVGVNVGVMIPPPGSSVRDYPGAVKGKSMVSLIITEMICTSVSCRMAVLK